MTIGASAPTMVRLTCIAPNPDRRRVAEPCGAVLGDVPGPLVFLGTRTRAPAAPDGHVWIRCTRRDCRTWNVFAPPGAKAGDG